MKQTPLEKIVAWIGSSASVVLHTVIFIGFFGAAIVNLISWDRMLLILTTVVSLEAIYLAIFIQMTVNRNTESLREVEEDIDEIQEDVEELGEDVEEMQEDIEEISEDIDEIQEDVEEMVEEEAPAAPRSLDDLAADIRRVLEDIEQLKGKK